MKRSWWRVAAIVGASLGVLGPASAELISTGKTAPVWSGKTVEGKPVSSAKLKGKVVLMNFFSYS